MELPFKGSIRKVSSSFVVTVPSDYVKQGLLQEKIKYKFTVDLENSEEKNSSGTEKRPPLVPTSSSRKLGKFLPEISTIF